MWVDMGRLPAQPGLSIAFIVAYFYGNAMRGAYKWHAQYRRAAGKLVGAADQTISTPPPAAASTHLLPQRFCVQCGTRVLADAKFCVSCGTAVNGAAAQKGVVTT